jgi:effector-binding domain-containing protein
MTDIEVRIVKLEPSRMASAYGFGREPEGQAAEKLYTFLKAKGIQEYRTFGFNNPDPSPGSPNYGYELWATVGPDVEPDGDIRIVNFDGGLYAVTRFKDLNQIGETWKKLVLWRETSQYRKACHQWLEELLNPEVKSIEEYVFDIYMPIAE